MGNKLAQAFLLGLFFCVPVLFVGSTILSQNPIVVESEEEIPKIVKLLDPPVVKAGQVWGLRSDGENPFKKHPIRMRIVAVKNGYVKYFFMGQEKFGEWAAQSEPAGYFTSHTKLIQDAR